MVVSGIRRDQRSTGFHGLTKELLEDLFFVAIPVGMLLPDERIGSHCVKIVKVLGSKRSEPQDLASQDGLKIKGQFRPLSQTTRQCLPKRDGYTVTGDRSVPSSNAINFANPRSACSG